jgi:rRNA maturation RNase YbeY
MPISFYTEDTPFLLKNKTQIRHWIKAIAKENSKQIGQISYVFCSDKKILEINKQYLNHDYYTDIISFDYSIKDRLSGDIFISIDTVHDNAKKFKVSVATELRRVIIHGLLHFIGLKDKTKQDAILMRKAENLALEKYCLLFHVEQN